MKNRNHLIVIALVALISAATSYAQTTTTPARPTVTPPAGTPAGSPSTGTTNSGGVAPAVGRPTETPTGPIAGGTGSGTTPVSPTTPDSSRPVGAPTGIMNPGTMPPAITPETRPTTTTGSGASNAPANAGKGTPHTVNENASDNAKAIQAVLKTFDAKRDALAAERKALIEKLEAAKTDLEKKAILDQLHTEQQAQAEERRALGKEMRNELKKIRDQRKSTGG